MRSAKRMTEWTVRLVKAMSEICKKCGPSTRLFLFEKLDCALMFAGGGQRGKGAQVSTVARLRVFFSGVQAVFARFQFADHGTEDAVPNRHGWSKRNLRRDCLAACA